MRTKQDQHTNPWDAYMNLKTLTHPGWTYRICLNDGQTLYYTIFGNNGYTNQTTRPTTTQLTTTQVDKHEESAKPQQSGPLIRERVK